MHTHSPSVWVGAVWVAAAWVAAMRYTRGLALVLGLPLGLAACGHSPTTDYAALRSVVFDARPGDGERTAALWTPIATDDLRQSSPPLPSALAAVTDP